MSARPTLDDRADELSPLIRKRDAQALQDRAFVERLASDKQETPADAARVEALAALPPLEYDRQREAAAGELGVRVTTLDAQVAARRASTTGTDAGMFAEITPWADPVDGAALLMAVGEVIKRHVIADRATIVAAALWCTHTYLLDVLTVSPIAHISAPEKRCGKTVLLSCLGRLAWRPLQASNISAAATFRAIEAWTPTLLVDEADSFLRDNEELRGVLNSGHTRQSAYVIRCDGEQNEPKKFSTWAAKAIAGIGKIADTLEDRAIPLRLRRKLPGESVDNLRRAPEAQFTTLCAKLVRWTTDHAREIGSAAPEPLAGLNDRATDNFEPLLAIADAAGGPWPNLAREAARALAGHDDERDAGDELLAAIREVFEANGVDRLPSAALIDALCTDTEGPWATWNRGKAITPRQVARKLGDYRISPGNMKLPTGHVAKGYSRQHFADAWARYLPSPETPHLSATPLQPKQDAGSSDFAIRYPSASVADEKARKAKQDATGSGVADENTPPGEVEV